MKKNTFHPDTSAGKKLKEWWLDLCAHNGDRAELRRAKDFEGLVLSPATIQLILALKETDLGKHGGWMDRMPIIAGLAAHLDTSENVRQTILQKPAQTPSLPLAMVRKEGDRPVVSELRFRRLLRYERKDLYRPMVRILSLLDNRANLFELAEVVFWWGPKIKKQWALMYFEKL